MTVETVATERSAAARELLTSLMSVKSWLRETPQWLYGPHSQTALYALSLVDRHGPCRVTALAEEARVDASVVSRQIAQLEQVGLLQREPDPADGRAHLVSISPEGSAVLEQGRERLAAMVDERLQDWSPEELLAFSDKLRRILTALTTKPHD